MMQISNTQMGALLNAAPDAMLIADQSGKIVLANAQAEGLFGYSRDELLERTIEKLLPPRFREAHVAQRGTYVAEPKVRPMGIGRELVALHKDGSEFPVEISLSPLETEAGLLVCSAIRDITRRKAVQDALIEARRAAERANRAKSAFLAAASHDLRQPLQTMTMLNRVLTAKARADAEIAEAAAMQHEAIKSMSGLLNSLLDISQLEAGAIRPDIQDVPVRALLRRLAARFSGEADAKGLTLELEERDVLVRTDPALLEQIVGNLLANAIRYTERGRVRVHCVDSGDTVCIEVLDTGVGIAKDELELIFEEFYRVAREPGHGPKGLGLGLSIVRRVADLIGHALDVESTPGAGSRFAVSVPKSEPQPSVSPIESSVLEAAGRNRHSTVLIIDDDEAVVHATAMFLEVLGYRTMTASGFEGAKVQLRETAQIPEVLICDYHLASGETGLETIQKIRGLARYAVPAILVTGDTSAVMSEMLDGIERCHLLSKPVDHQELTALIRELVSSGELVR